MKTKGVEVARKLDKLGMRASDTAQIYLRRRARAAALPHRRGGHGLHLSDAQFQEERLWAAAAGLMEMDARSRRPSRTPASARPSASRSSTTSSSTSAWPSSRPKVELLRSLVYRAVEEYVGGEDVTLLASMAKLKAGRLAREVTDGCLQYWGGMGFMSDSAISRLYRDRRLISIGGGADEVMLGIICKLMGILPGKKKNH